VGAGSRPPDKACIVHHSINDLFIRQQEYMCVDGWIILKWIFKKWDGEAYNGLLWLRIGTGGGHLCMWL
jgi:hypothetical protein